MSDLPCAVTEQVPVGSRHILESPHVSEGPGRIAKAPVPSIYVDDRGDIHRLRVGGQRINLLFSKQGVMRSGYLHPHIMQDVVIKGQVEVWYGYKYLICVLYLYSQIAEQCCHVDYCCLPFFCYPQSILLLYRYQPGP